MATHSSVLAWRIPGAGEPGGLTSMGSHRVGHDWSDLAAVAAAALGPAGLVHSWSEVKVAQSCLTLCDPMDYTVHGVLQARILEWVAFPFSEGSSQPRDRTRVSCIAGGFFTNWVIRESRFTTGVSVYARNTAFSCDWQPHPMKKGKHLPWCHLAVFAH